MDSDKNILLEYETILIVVLEKVVFAKFVLLPLTQLSTSRCLFLGKPMRMLYSGSSVVDKFTFCVICPSLVSTAPLLCVRMDITAQTSADKSCGNLSNPSPLRIHCLSGHLVA